MFFNRIAIVSPIFLVSLFWYFLPSPAQVLEKYSVNALGDGWVDDWMDMS